MCYTLDYDLDFRFHMRVRQYTSSFFTHLAGSVVFAFFANLRMSLLCVLTVFLSLIDVFGLIYYYGLTLEPVTAMTMTILIGLCIDFSIHVGKYRSFNQSI